jgi:hypothetical protein
MSETTPPLRPATPTLDTFHQMIVPGRQRFYKSPDLNELGERDEALDMYTRKRDDFHGVDIAPGLLALVNPDEAKAATEYAVDYARWCEDYKGGFNAGDTPRVADPPIIPASVLAEPVKKADPPPPPAFPPFPPRPAVVVPSAKKAPSLLARFAAWINRPLL